MTWPTVEQLRVPGSRTPWRPDVEGLRGVAVLLVVFYHAGVPGFTGGYVGVDVFFALSGYLITGILASEVERTGRLDFGRFFARRVRRLLPAAAVVLLTVTAFAFVAYPPIGQEPIAETALATAAYVSNIHFALSATDYHAVAAETDPLLHTWSLAVEEQFYLVWPFLVLVAMVGLPSLRREPDGGHGRVPSRRLIWAMVAVGVATFALTVYLMGTLRAHWAFFASPARAWEFAVGGIAALAPRLRLTGRPKDEAAVGAQVLGWAGIVAVVAAGVLYNAETPFPGWAALVPVVGTVWALRAGVGQPTTALSRVLTWRPLREAGRLSYSWYLWHWPVLVFANGLYGEGVGDPLSFPVRIALLALSLLLAEGSYRLVENPVRYQPWLSATPRRAMALLAVLTASGVALAFGWGRAAESASLSSPELARYKQAAADVDGLGGGEASCLAPLEGADLLRCSLGDTTSSTVVALFGDSHAYHWLPAAERVATERGWRLEVLVKSMCAPVDGPVWSHRLGREYTECGEWRARAIEAIGDMQPDVVLVNSFSGGYEDIEPGLWRAGTTRVLDQLAQRSGSVVLIRDTPDPHFDVPTCLYENAWRGGRGEKCMFEPDRADPKNQEVYDVQVAAAEVVGGVATVDLNPYVCPSSPCSPVEGDVVKWRDAHHLTATFSRSLAPPLGAAIDENISRTESIESEIDSRRRGRRRATAL